jgi:hypothetical protein
MAPERLLEIRELGRGPTAFQGGAHVRLAARGALENAAAASLAVRPAGTHSGGEDRVCAAAVAARRRWRRGGDARFLGVDRSHARRAAREKPSGRTAVDLSLDGPILEVRVAPLVGGARRLGEALAIVDIAQARRLATDFAPVIKGVTDGGFSEKVDLADDMDATSSAATGFNELMTVAEGMSDLGRWIASLAQGDPTIRMSDRHEGAACRRQALQPRGGQPARRGPRH